MNAVDGALRGLVVWKSGKTCGETAVYVVQWKSVLSYTLNVADVPNARWALYTWSVCSFVISLNKFCIFRYLRLWSLAWRPLDSRSNHGLFLTLVRQYFMFACRLTLFLFPLSLHPTNSSLTLRFHTIPFWFSSFDFSTRLRFYSVEFEP